MTLIDYLGLTLLLFFSEFLYFHTAKKYGIIDIPNNRSAHQKATIRGIGILFPIAVLCFFVLSGFQYPFFILGLFLISIVSFIDDIRTLPNRYRIATHFISIGLLLFEVFQASAFTGILVTVPLLVIGVGIINAYNFMDGINGITGAYSLLTIFTLFYIDNSMVSFINAQLLFIVGISVCIFLFFNFRKKAVGFCGDVGSVSIAFVIVFCLGMLVQTSGEWKYIFLLAAYGIDTIYTLVYRLLNGENIFKAHKLHFFQLLVHEYRWSHLKVSTLFVVAQGIINLVVIQYQPTTIIFYVPILFVLLVVHYYRRRKFVSLF